MKKLVKKAFTLVELLVVIAILAVLATVSIIGYSNFASKGQISTATSLVKQLNTWLEADEVGGRDYYTMYDLQQRLDSQGVGVDVTAPNLIAANGYHLGYDVVQNRVVLLKALNSTDVVEAPDNYKWNKVEDVFVPVSGSEFEGGQNMIFSSYLTSTTTSKTLTAVKGLDVGEVEDIEEVKYVGTTATQEVTIRTNSHSTTLTIAASKDTVNHYGKANKVNVETTATHSYREDGNVLGNITLQNGKVVVKSHAKANAIYVDASASDIANGTVVVAADNSLVPQIPVIVRDEVKQAADEKGGENSIPNPTINNVIVLSDYVKDEQGNNTSTVAEAYLTSTKKNYATIQEAIDAMVNNDTLVLLKDVEECPVLTTNKGTGNYKIDLNSHTISFATTGISSGAMAFTLDGDGTYTVCNGTLSSLCSTYGDLLEVWSNTTLNNLTINNKDEVAPRWGAIYSGSDNLVINSCTVNAISGPAIQNGEENAKTTINDSVVISEDHSALYCGGSSITEVNNSTVQGVRAVHACTSGATFILNSGKFIGSSKAIQLDNSLNAVDWEGTPNYSGGSFALVYGGTYTGSIQVATRPGVAQLYVYGGTFSVDVSSYRA